jgi:indolepyruvate ferredoxin oxidoreductase, beta subunit
LSVEVTNVVVAGLGGQGVLTCSDILANAAFLAGLDVKKAEVHGMSQRGGSVACDVRFGRHVLSPMVPAGQADYLLVLSEDQAEVARPCLRPDGILLLPSCIQAGALVSPRSLNVAMLGLLSTYLDMDMVHWRAAIQGLLPAKLHEMNLNAFDAGRNSRTLL